MPKNTAVRFRVRIRAVLPEFLRYCVVGSTSFLLDFGILTALYELWLNRFGETGLYIATATGFIVGLIYNYLLSVRFAFRVGKDSPVGRRVRDKLVFVAVGIVGLLLTELGMYLGTQTFAFNYLLVKPVVTLIVFFWNYLGRKLLVFRTRAS